MTRFSCLEDFITHLKNIPEVLGIVEYGGRTYTDMSLGGDYDLTVILNQKISTNFNGFHFHIGDIPVDCMIITLDNLSQDYPDNEFLLVHLDCEILFDRDGSVEKALDIINTTWRRSPDLNSVEISLYRFTFQHILDKLQHRLNSNPLYSSYFIYASFDWYLTCYARINNLPVGKAKHHLKFIEENDTVLFSYVHKLYESHSLEERFLYLSKCAELISKPIGGLWRKDEILFHQYDENANLPREKEKLINLLL